MAKRKQAPIAAPWRLHVQDCLTGIPHHVRSGTPVLATYDPPYNVGQDYSDYVDRKTQAEYLKYLEPRLKVTYDHLHEHGSLYILINTANQSEVDVLCKDLGFKPKNKIVWFYTFGQNHSKNFTSAHATWLYYTKHRSKCIFNADDPAVRVPSARQLIYNDKRANPRGRLPDNAWIMRPQEIPEAFEPHLDFWCFSRVCGTFKAKIQGSPNQVPVAMMERIVRLSSNPGDLVIDGFNGTGTSGEAAIKLGRRYIGFDLSAGCIAETEKRLQRALADRKAAADDPQLGLFDQSKATASPKRKKKA